MKLSTLQKEFLSAAVLSAEEPIPVLAKSLKAKTTHLRYALDQLLTNKVIRAVPMLDRSRLGFQDYHVLFSIAVQSADARSRFVNELCKAPGIVFFAEIGGDFNYEIIIASRTPHGPSLLLDTISNKFKVRIHSKSIASGFRFELFPKRYFRRSVKAVQNQKSFFSLREKPTTDSVSLDKIDSGLLSLLSADSRLSLRELGQKLNITHTAVNYRISKLRDQGILHGLYYDVEPLAYGYQDFILQFTISENRANLEKRLFTVAREYPAISYAASYFGAWDFELGVEVSKAEEIVTISQELCEALGSDFSLTRMLFRFRQLALRPYPF